MKMSPTLRSSHFFPPNTDTGTGTENGSSSKLIGSDAGGASSAVFSVSAAISAVVTRIITDPGEISSRDRQHQVHLIF